MPRIIATIALTWLFIFPSCANADLIIDDFETEVVNPPLPQKSPSNFFSFGDQLSDSGVGQAFAAGGSNLGAFYVIDFDVPNSFGVGAAREGISLQLSLTDSIVVDIKLHNGNTPAGFVAFRITDEDGTIMRTSDSDLFSIDSSYGTIAQPIGLMTTVDAIGTQAGLDLQKINSVGLLFFDQSFTGTATVAFDNLRVSAVPEPSSGLFVACIFLPVLIFRRVRRLYHRNLYSKNSDAPVELNLANTTRLGA